MKKTVVAALAIVFCASVSMAAVIDQGADVLDQVVRGDGTVGTSLNWVGQQQDQISGVQNSEYIAVFQLPGLGGEAISSANLSITLLSQTWQAWGNGDVYGVRSAATGAVALSDYAPFVDAAGNGTKIMDNFYVNGTGTASFQTLETDAAGDAALAGWLAAQYVAVGEGGYVFLRLQPDDMAAVGSHAIDIATADNTAQATPVLQITTIPEPATAGILGLGALIVMMARRRIRK